MMETQVSVTTETLSILTTSHNEFRIFKVGICFAYFGSLWSRFPYIIKPGDHYCGRTE